ncbi:helix-turn-helix domain-containing protein [Bradyrhizobium cytisi]|uniref:Uncharacterized protein n=1 Tax=Bradyrhizobium cytisi TaxID=515489 RepID=A0A5S4X0K7_9BRAD|nr:hypothetical protein [Bradyrhizobium cytisi]TYL87797.1 hypothetical protein FXB38_03185 [Bradyrhizobium cytisi]
MLDIDVPSRFRGGLQKKWRLRLRKPCRTLLNMKPRLIGSREQLLQVVRERRDELDLSHDLLDCITGLQNGYVSKLLSDPPVRGFGEMSLKAVLDALGLRIGFAVIMEDQEQAERVRARWRPRKRRPTKQKPAAPAAPAETLWCVASDPQIMPDGASTNLTEANDGKHEDDWRTDRT